MPVTRKPTPREPLLGAHFSIAKGLHNALLEAVAYRCNTLQMFTKNATTWKERILSDEEIRRFRQTSTETGIKVIASHTSYLINLAAVEKKKHTLALNALTHELIRCARLCIPLVVLHPGAHMGKGEEAGMMQITESINTLLDRTSDMRTRLLLETTAGQGSGLGHSFDQLAWMLKRIKHRERIGVCLDTCHIFAAGYDIRTKETYRNTIKQFDSLIGIEQICLIHLNDSKKDLGSRVDRHTHIGAGCIGLEAFSFIMNDKRFSGIPKIIETEKGQKGKDWDKINLERLRGLVRSR